MQRIKRSDRNFLFVSGDIELNPGPVNTSSMSVLTTWLARIGQKPVNIVGDGNCLFRSVLTHQLYRTESRHAQIRCYSVTRPLFLGIQYSDQYSRIVGALGVIAQQNKIIDILYTLDSASNYSAIQKLKPWLQTQDIPMKWEIYSKYIFKLFKWWKLLLFFKRLLASGKLQHCVHLFKWG
jgi:hypothetical protein